MAGGLQVQVRQIASYPAPLAVAPNDLALIQEAGLGGPYASASTYQFVLGALSGVGGLGLGIPVPANANSTLFTDVVTYQLDNGGPWWNAYLANDNTLRYWRSGVAGHIVTGSNGGMYFQLAPAGQAGTQISGAAVQNLAVISAAGAMSLPRGTLTVARDPAAALEVATMGWTGANTVGSFNGRRGVVTLNAADISCALGYPVECIATLPQVNEAICAAIQDLIHTYPAVWSWNGRVGDVWLAVEDINLALARPGAPPLLIPTPPADATNGEAVNAEWVINYITQTAGFATEEWVNQQLAQLAANTVTSFNGRQGPVLLTLNDITSAGGAPTASPDFSGIPTGPTANTGTSTAQLATTAFVMNTIVALTPGVVSFNGRTGTVTLSETDINNAGGALLNSPNFTGTPAAPTAPNGTATSQIATTAFVMAEIAATTAGVVSFNGRSGVVTLQTADITAAGGAPNASPALTGTPTAPTAANGTSTQQLATTAFVMNEINAINAGVLTFNGRSGTVNLTQNDVTAVGGLVNPNAALTGTPTAPTPAPTDNSTNIATTAFVHAALANVTGGATVSNTPPASPTTGMFWFNTADAQTYVWNGATWVIAVNPPLGNYLPTAGGNITGNLNVGGNLSVTGTTTLAGTTVTTLTATSTTTLAGTTVTTLNATGATTLAATTTTALTATGQFNPQGGIQGVTNASNAAAGQVGEYVASSGSVNISYGAFSPIAAITLGPGDWDIWGALGWTNSTGSGVVTSIQAAFSTTNNNWSGAFLNQYSLLSVPGAPTMMAVPMVRWNSTATATITIVSITQGSGYSTITMSGQIYARRVR